MKILPPKKKKKKKKKIFRYKVLIFLHFLLKPFLDNKMSIFEEYGANKRHRWVKLIDAKI